MNFNLENAQGILVDYRVDSEVKRYLEVLDKEIFYTVSSDYLMEDIDGHPDIFACAVNNTTIFEPRLFELYKENLKDYNVVSGSKSLGKIYPNDIAYNVAVVGKVAIGRIDFVDMVLLDLINKEGCAFINVNQGYAKCSVAIVDEKSIITSDQSIVRGCEGALDVKLVAQDESIELGSMYGFVGGASFSLGNKLIFFGDYKTHKDNYKIEEFCKAKGVEPISIGSGRLKDYGGIVPLYKK